MAISAAAEAKHHYTHGEPADAGTSQRTRAPSIHEADMRGETRKVPEQKLPVTAPLSSPSVE
jgi:hypothetical protein